MRVLTKNPLCVEEVEKLLNVKDYNTLYNNLKKFVYGLWAQDQLTDYGYDEIEYAIDTCFKNNKILKETEEVKELKMRMIPTDDGGPDLQYFDGNEWDTFSYIAADYYNREIRYNSNKELWEAIKKRIEEPLNIFYPDNPEYKNSKYKNIKLSNKKNVNLCEQTAEWAATITFVTVKGK